MVYSMITDDGYLGLFSTRILKKTSNVLSKGIWLILQTKNQICSTKISKKFIQSYWISWKGIFVTLVVAFLESHNLSDFAILDLMKHITRKTLDNEGISSSLVQDLESLMDKNVN